MAIQIKIIKKDNVFNKFKMTDRISVVPVTLCLYGLTVGNAAYYLNICTFHTD